MPTICNLRLDPFERMNWFQGNAGSFQYWDWYKYQFWGFVFVQDQVAKLAMTAIEYPPMQKGASFNLDGEREDPGRPRGDGQVTP